MGQAPGLRRPLRPPCARPAVFPRSTRQTSSHRIVFDIQLNAPEFLAATNQMIIALVLPECLAGPPQEFISSPGSGSLQTAKQLR